MVMPGPNRRGGGCGEGWGELRSLIVCPRLSRCFGVIATRVVDAFARWHMTASGGILAADGRAASMVCNLDSRTAVVGESFAALGTEYGHLAGAVRTYSR